MPLYNTLKSFYQNYEMPLARKLYEISQRGLQTSQQKLTELRQHITHTLKTECLEISKLTGKLCAPNSYLASAMNKAAGQSIAVNLNSQQQLVALLTDLGLKLPKSRETGNATTAKEVLFELFGKTGNKVLEHLLTVGEYNHAFENFVSVELLNGVFYSDFVSTGTVTGRRSSRSNILDLGGNGQNIPKHTDLGLRQRECIVARPGKILLSCDQRAAEDWIVHGIIADQSGITTGLDELRNGVKRHQKLASFMFSKPFDQVDKTTIQYYLAKKGRHGNNYKIGANRLSTACAHEKVRITPDECKWLLQMVNKAEPQIGEVFQRYVEETLIKTRELITPVGRRRYFLGLRNYSNNNDVFRDGYSYIPQSTVGDNTGLAILDIERNAPGSVLLDVHDAVVCEVGADRAAICQLMSIIEMAFARTFTMPGGLQLQIPVEFELGFNLKDMFTVEHNNVGSVLDRCREVSQKTGLAPTVSMLSQPPAPQTSSSGGQQPPLSLPL